ncbi:MAG: FAD-dependent oxidoreductase [Candidatus Lokiarchaeota archaeon]|nr:FAD-dependent oxidoreductase [Candidatus Lokiarchaeota archaeon]MBD3342635.1 FAD-dependent oxidoreductase [Candidatus Lokiarchaeota archaeon]
MYDVIIIGGGVTGCTIARTLSKYDIKTAVLEKEADISCGTTKANSGVIHAGYAAEREYVKRQLCIRGNKLYTQAWEELHFPFQRIGSFVVAVEDEQIKDLDEKRKKGTEDGVPGLELILNKEKIKHMEPNLTDDVVGVLHAPTAGLASPYELTIALAENAAMNGVKFFRNQEVIKIKHRDYIFTVTTRRGEFKSRNLINAAGLYAAHISRMLGLDYFDIIPRKGEYILFDRNALHLNKILFPIPTKVSKGILVCPTLHGNTFVGPNAQNITDLEDTSTTTAGLKEIIEGGRQLIPNLPLRASIRNFAGLRAVPTTYDFIIDNTDIYGFINVAGILSPGLTSCFAIAERVVEFLELLGVQLKIKEDYNPVRPKPERFAEFTKEELDKKIREDPAWGRIICRCETIPEKEILDAIHAPVGARTVDGIKFRCRPGMGRCQGGFCRPRVIEILSRELGLSYEEITKKGEDTNFLVAQTKEIVLKELKSEEEEA